MSPAHLHLLVNHLPVFAPALALPILLGALWARSRGAWTSGVLLLVIGALGAVAADQSGEGAEDWVEEQPGVREAAIHAHEEAAEGAVIVSLVTGAVALAGWWLARRDAWQRPAIGATTVAAAASFGMMALAGSSGGEIRHAAEMGADAAAGGLVSDGGEDEAHERGEGAERDD